MRREVFRGARIEDPMIWISAVSAFVAVFIVSAIVWKVTFASPLMDALCLSFKCGYLVQHVDSTPFIAMRADLVFTVPRPTQF